MKVKTTQEIELPDFPEAPQYHKWEYAGLAAEGISPPYLVYSAGDSERWQEICLIPSTGLLDSHYAKLVRTHHDSGIPIDLEDYVPSPGFEIVEVIDNRSGDTKIDFNKHEWWDFNLPNMGFGKILPRRTESLFDYIIDRHRVYVALRKGVTKLSDLLGEDFQKRAYLIFDDETWEVFGPEFCPYYGFLDCTHGSHEMVSNDIRWSHSPFTPYEEANKFRFPELSNAIPVDENGVECPSCKTHNTHEECGTYEVMNPACKKCGNPTEAWD